MKHFIWLLYGVTGMAVRVCACDVCGSSGGSQQLGLLPDVRLHFISVQYQRSGFESNHPSLFSGKPNEHSRDYYSTFQVWGKYAVSRRLQVFGFVPYRYNVQHSDTSRYRSDGVGDASVLANVLVVNTDVEERWRHQVLAGGGVKLPTGQYAGITEMDRQGLPNMQPGTGSWDFIANVNYTARMEAMGLNVDAAYTFTTANADAYKYGNKLSAGVVGFYQWQMGKVRVLPQAGVRYEYSLHDYDNYGRKWLNEQSGGYMCFATAGVQGYYRKMGVRLVYQLPVSQHYSAGFVTAKHRMDAGIFFLL